jgi:hypothetical protein
MEDFLMSFETTYQKIFQNQPKNFQESDFVSIGLKFQSYLFMNNSKLKELFNLFAADNQVKFIFKIIL